MKGKKRKFFYIILGIVILKFGKSLSSILMIFYKNFWRKPKNIEDRYLKGSWAIVTGSTDDLGQGFCFELASRGFNLILIAKNYEKNEILMQDLKKTFKEIKAINIGLDFKESNRQKFFELLFEKISHLDISILVNNAGKYGVENFEIQDEKEIQEILNVNCFPVTLLTRKIIPKMLERNQKSAIINVSSLLAVKPCPYMAVFAATKAFIDNFTLALSLEEKINEKIDVLSLKVFQVTNNFANQHNGFWTIESWECAKACLEKLGYENSTFGHWKHEIINLVYNIFPETLRVSFFNNMMKE